MTTETKTVKTVNTVVAIRPKSKTEAGFIYRTPDQLPDLIKFVGVPATLNVDGSISFKRTIVKPGTVVLRDEFGNVRTMTFEECETRYDIVADKPFEPKDANKVVPKVKPSKE